SCKSTEKAASSEVQGATSLRAQIGGQLVPVGAHNVELRLFKNGVAEAIVVDARGAAIGEPAQARGSVHANAKGSARAHPAVALAYEPATARFDGKAAVDLEPGPVDVELRLGEVNARGTLAGPVLLVGPEMGGTLVVAGRHGVELLVRADGAVDAIVHDAAGH